MKAAPNAFIDKLGERGFAGGDVAASPSRDDDPFWPIGESPAGVNELIDLLLSAAKKKAGAKKESHWAFLLGGAGNGKSFAARTLLNRLAPSSRGRREASAPKRKYAFKGADYTVTVINDATIAGKGEYKENTRVALAEDLALWAGQATKGRSFAFACVNRGIVLEELHCLSRLNRKGLAFSEAVLRWLDGAGQLVFEDPENLSWIQAVDGSPPGPWYRRVRLRVGKSFFIVIHALSVDVGSLFEPRSGDNLDLNVDSPVRPEIGVAAHFRHSASDRLESVAGKLVRSLIGGELQRDFDSRPPACPLRANFLALSADEPRASWLTTLRAAEIAAGRQVTYRDFWGLVVLSLVGPRTLTHLRGRSNGGVVPEVDSLLAELDNTTAPAERLAVLGRLALRRLHMAVFRGDAAPSADEAGREAPPEFPSYRGLMLIDPAADVTLNSAEVERAMEHLSLGSRPSEYLLKHLPALAQSWQPFDAALEEAVIAVLRSDESSDRLRRRVQSWFSGYLHRAVGCYVGGIGHEGVITAWYRCWHAASAANAQFPAELNVGLRTLLLPSLSFQQNLELQMTVPAFSSRAIPFESPESADGALVLSMGVGHLRLRPVRRLDRLWIELVSADSKVVAQSPLDFLLIREALVCRSSMQGFTEAGTETAPRLERARASMVSTGSDVARYFALVAGGRLRELGS